MGGTQSLALQRKGLQYDPKKALENQLHPVEEENGSPIARLKPFIFHVLQLRISVQASWSTHCSYEDNGVIRSYPIWQGYAVPVAERGPFPLHRATTFELAIERLDGTNSFLDPRILTGIITDTVVEALVPCSEGEEISSEVPKAWVIKMLNQLTEAETRESNEQIKRTKERDAVYREELIQHVWHPSKMFTFKDLGVWEDNPLAEIEVYSSLVENFNVPLNMLK